MSTEHILAIATIIIAIVQFFGTFAYKTLSDKCDRAEKSIELLNNKVDEKDREMRKESKEQNEKVLASLNDIKNSISKIELDIAKNYVDYDVFSKVLNEFPCHRLGFFDQKFDCSTVKKP